MKKTVTLLTLVIMSSLFGIVEAQDMSKYGETEEQQTLCLEALTIYRQFRDQKLPETYGAWQEALKVCPCTAAERMYSDGAKFIKQQIKAEKEDKERIQVLIDSLVMVYDARIECYPSTKKYPDGKNACNVKAYKAIDMMKLKRMTEDEGLEVLGEAVKCLGNLSKATFISDYYVKLYKKFDAVKKAGDNPDLQKELNERLIIEYLDLSNYCKYNIKNQEKEKVIESYKLAQGNLDEIFVVIASCDDMVPVLMKMVEEAPDNIEVKEKALNLMNIKNCGDDEKFLDFYLEVATDVCDTNKTPECLFSIGIAYLKKGNSKESLTYLEEAAEMCGDCDDAERYLLRAGQVAVSLGQASKGMSYANKILAINANSGEAYMLKGDAAASMSGACDDGRLGFYCAYWVAVDYYGKAKAVDSSVANKANKKIANAKKGYPTLDKVFEVGEAEGNTFSCGCLGTSTTIRVRK